MPYLTAPPPKYHDITPRPFQYAILESDAKYKVICAGRRCGKTWTSCLMAFAKAISADNQVILFIGRTHRSIKNAVFKQLQEIIPPSYVAKINESTREITLKNGSTFMLYGSDNAEALRGMSPSPDLICCDELAYWQQQSAYDEVVEPMVGDKDSPLIITSTPKMEADIFHQLFERGRNQTDPNLADYMSWQFKTYDVRDDMRKYIDQRRLVMDEATFKREWEADFTNSLDTVYYNFKYNTHVSAYKPIDRIRARETLLIAIDFNVRKMCCSVSVERDDKLYVMEEFQGDANTQALCNTLKKEFPKHHANNKIIVYPDPAGAASKTNQALADTDIAIIQQNGFEVNVKRKHPAVLDSVNAVNALLLNANNEVRMHVNRKCNGVVQSLLGTQWKDNPNDPGMKKIDKAMDNDHFTDGLRYLIDYRYPIHDERMGFVKSEFF